MAYQTINPYTQDVLKTFDLHTDREVEKKLADAYALYQSSWSKPTQLANRLQSLHQLADMMQQRAHELAHTITIEMGKRLVESRGEVACCVDIVRYYAENGNDFMRPVSYSNKLGDAWVEYHPIGVILGIEPWNFPFYQLVRVIAPAMVVGNPVLIKHASNVPQCADMMAQLVQSVAPKGAYDNLFVSPKQIESLIADDRIQGVALTGSERAGSTIAALAGGKLKKTTMELGGNDAFIVLDDANIPKAVAAAVEARLGNAGQVCTAAKRFIVQEKVAEQFTAGIIHAFGLMKMGDPLAEDTTLSPLSSSRAKKDLQAQLDRAIEHGAQVLYGNQPADGNFFHPTLITNISRQNPAYFEEFFGPVAQLYVVDSDDDEAVAVANDSHYGLGATIFSGNVERAKQLASDIEAGMIFINQNNDSIAELPFGGVKRSGFGRELSDLGVKEFVNQKLVLV